jgi:hypothetical protein
MSGTASVKAAFASLLLLLMGANDGISGFELWAFPRPGS